MRRFNSDLRLHRFLCRKAREEVRKRAKISRNSSESCSNLGRRAQFGVTVKEENPEARAAGRELIKEGVAALGKRRTFVFVNNRLERMRLRRIEAMAG